MTARVGELIHADWSVDPRKRWAAFAKRDAEGGFTVERIDLFELIPREIIAAGANSGLLLGFDFPIGVPSFYAEALQIKSFTEFLGRLSDPEFSDFARPAETIAEISLYRPFFPKNSGGRKHEHLVRAHGLKTFNELRRICERSPLMRPAACALFWTLGGNQVGRAAIAGWLEILAPLKAEGSARFWPFDGPLATLTSTIGTTVAETYPAEAMRFLEIHPGGRFSKLRQDDRRGVADRIRAAAQRSHVSFSPSVAAEIADGFGSDKRGDDRFDALLGLLGLAAVLENRPEGVPDDTSIRTFEGWILGQNGSGYQPSKVTA